MRYSHSSQEISESSRLSMDAHKRVGGSDVVSVRFNIVDPNGGSASNILVRSWNLAWYNLKMVVGCLAQTYICLHIHAFIFMPYQF